MTSESAREIERIAAEQAADEQRTRPSVKQRTFAPFANCKYRICDLPGQCRAEGQCHHPMSGTSAPDLLAERDRLRAENKALRSSLELTTDTLDATRPIMDEKCSAIAGQLVQKAREILARVKV